MEEAITVPNEGPIGERWNDLHGYQGAIGLLTGKVGLTEYLEELLIDPRYSHASFTTAKVS